MNYQKARKAEKMDEPYGLFPAFFNTSMKVNSPGKGPGKFDCFQVIAIYIPFVLFQKI
jgi:hypothetical protein